MKEESGRILKRPVLSVLVAAALYTPQVMAFTEEVTGGSTVTDETVENGTQYVLNKGKTDNITVGVNGHQFVYGGGITNSTVINEGGKQWVYSGGTATGTTIKSGGKLGISSGGKATGVEQQEGAALVATTGTGTVVSGSNAHGDFSIKDGQADNVLLENGGELTVVNGTTATNTTIKSGGILNVQAGGKATGVEQQDGAALDATTVTGTVVSGKNTLGDFSIENGWAENVLLENGGWLDVMDGTTATDTTIKQGGTLNVKYGGKATGVEQQDGAALIAYTSTGTVVSGKNTLGDFSIKDGQAENVLLENGGWLYVMDGTTATGTTIRDGGNQAVYFRGTATGTSIEKGGTQYVYGTAENTTIRDGGNQAVYFRGTATGTSIEKGGKLDVREGGQATGVEQQEGAALIATTSTGTVVNGKNTLGDFSIKDGQADKVLLENGGQLTVVNETTADHTTIRDGGKLIVNDGGTTRNTGIESGGLQIVKARGTAEGTTIKQGGTLNVEDGGKATGVEQQEGAALIATTDKNTVVSGENTRGEFSINAGQA
ncbi:hypothetical protein F9222_26085, partial [Escherichia coli]